MLNISIFTKMHVYSCVIVSRSWKVSVSHTMYPCQSATVDPCPLIIIGKTRWSGPFWQLNQFHKKQSSNKRQILIYINDIKTAKTLYSASKDTEKQNQKVTWAPIEVRYEPVQRISVRWWITPRYKANSKRENLKAINYL